MYQQLGETPGVPRLLHKGFQDNFCIMVRSLYHSVHQVATARPAQSSVKQQEACDASHGVAA